MTRPPPTRSLQLEPTLDRARGIAGVERVTYGSFFAQPPGLIEGGPEGVSVMSLAGGPDSIEPTIIDGHAPAAPNGILFSPRLLHDQGLHVGDTLTIHGARASAFRVVGTGILRIANVRVDRAAVSLTFDGLRRIRPDEVPEHGARRRRSRRRHQADRRTARASRPERRPGNHDLDLAGFSNLDVRQAQSVPRLLGILMGILAAGVLVHLVATGVRARRLELATLRSLGFTPRQTHAAVAWQATTVVVVAIGIGSVIGVVAGRGVWSGYAERLVVSARAGNAVAHPRGGRNRRVRAGEHRELAGVVPAPPAVRCRSHSGSSRSRSRRRRCRQRLRRASLTRTDRAVLRVGGPEPATDSTRRTSRNARRSLKQAPRGHLCWP